MIRYNILCEVKYIRVKYVCSISMVSCVPVSLKHVYVFYGKVVLVKSVAMSVGQSKKSSPRVKLIPGHSMHRSHALISR